MDHYYFNEIKKTTQLIPGRGYVWEGPAGEIANRLYRRRFCGSIYELAKETAENQPSSSLEVDSPYFLGKQFKKLKRFIWISASAIQYTIDKQKSTATFKLTYIGQCLDGSISYFKIGKCVFGVNSIYCRETFKKQKRKFSIMKGHIFPSIGR